MGTENTRISLHIYTPVRRSLPFYREKEPLQMHSFAHCAQLCAQGSAYIPACIACIYGLHNHLSINRHKLCKIIIIKHRVQGQIYGRR